jgi:hypothetical protein
MTVLIKRYANRKLYNTQTSRYITLKGIAAPGSILSDMIHKGGDALYGALRRGVGDATDSIEDFQRNVRKVIQTREEEAAKLRESITFGKSDIDRVVQNAMERVFKLLDLPRRSDIEALNDNLGRVAEAIDRLDPGREPGLEPEADEAQPADEA